MKAIAVVSIALLCTLSVHGLRMLPSHNYKKDCWQKWPVSLVQGQRNPGAGINPFEPFSVVLKDGFMSVACVKDKLFFYGDKFGDGRQSYTLGDVTNISIVHYAAHVPKEDRKPMTQNVCFEFCRTVPEMNYFGIMNGRECYCAPYYEMMAGDSSSCDAPCEGDTTRVCGGKHKSSIFGMHMCASTKSDLAEASEKTNIMAGDLKTRIHLASELAKSMQEAGAKNQMIFGKAGDPAASDLMQNAKVFAGDLLSAAKASGQITSKLAALVKKSSELEDFEKPATVTKAERLMEAMKEAVNEAELSQGALGDVIRLARPGREELRAAAQYYPLMYFIDKSFSSTMQTCSGEIVGKPIVGESIDGCASACDYALHSCVGFSYFGTGSTSLCFLFSGLKSAVYYTGCEAEEKGSLLQNTEHGQGDVNVQPWDCGSVGRPFQVINEEGKSLIKALDIATGTYELVLEVEKSLTKPKFSKINACGVNPVDSIIYCAMQFQRNGYLARIDSSHVGFVAKLPGKGMYSAEFDEKGNYYFNGGSLFKILEVQKLPAHASQYSLRSTMHETVAKTSMGADLAVVEADFEGTGVGTYVLSLSGKNLKVVRVSSEPAKVWTLKGDGLGGSGGWGATWNFKKEVFFANNGGAGVYQLDLASVNLKEKTAKFVKAGSSTATNSNDGLGCAHGRSPFPPVIKPHPRPYDEAPPAEPERESVHCMVKLSKFEGTTFKPDPKGKCKQCLKELKRADRCY